MHWLTGVFFGLLALIPSFVWLLFYLHEDFKHPEPKRLIFFTFLGGAAITAPVLLAQIMLNRWLPNFVAAYSPGALFGLAAIEESFKFLAAFWVVGRSKDFDEPLDAMIYIIVAALGFAAVENVASIFQAVRGVASTGPIETTMLRFVGATLLHTLSSGLVGYYWGMAIIEKRAFIARIGSGLVLATVLHTLFNYLILRYETITVPIIFLIFAGFFLLHDFENLKKLEGI